MGRSCVAPWRQGLGPVLPPARSRLIVPRRQARACADSRGGRADGPQTRARRAEAARLTSRQYDISTFVSKMEQLYDLLHRVSRATHRRGVPGADLEFLAR